MNTTAILRLAADLIETHGWTTSGWGNRADGFSIVGAMFEAGGINPDTDEAFSVLDDSLEAPQDWYLTNHIRFDCDAWENASGRTQQEVVSKLREVAETASRHKTMNKTTNTLAGFTFPVINGNDVYKFDEIETLVRDHADGDAYAEGDDSEGWTIRVRQQAIKPAIGSGWTELEAWQNAAKEILNGATGSGYSNDDSWDDLNSATDMLNDLDADDESRYIFESRIETLTAAGAK